MHESKPSSPSSSLWPGERHQGCPATPASLGWWDRPSEVESARPVRHLVSSKMVSWPRCPKICKGSLTSRRMPPLTSVLKSEQSSRADRGSFEQNHCRRYDQRSFPPSSSPFLPSLLFRPLVESTKLMMSPVISAQQEKWVQ